MPDDKPNHYKENPKDNSKNTLKEVQKNQTQNTQVKKPQDDLKNHLQSPPPEPSQKPKIERHTLSKPSLKNTQESSNPPQPSRSIESDDANAQPSNPSNPSNQDTSQTWIAQSPIYLLPNLLTTLAMALGFWCIHLSFQNNFALAAMMIFIASVLDNLDGRLARLTKTETEFGKQYDSLADMISFGCAPAVLIYAFTLNQLGNLGGFLAFLYLAAVATRLARFNVLQSEEGPQTNPKIDPQLLKSNFQGLPSPAGALCLSSWAWLGAKYDFSQELSLAVMIVLCALVAFLMVSNVLFANFKRNSDTPTVPFGFALMISVLVVGVLINPPVILFIYSITYIAIGLLKSRTKKARQPLNP